MAGPNPKSIFRLRKKHEPSAREKPDAHHGARIVAAQSVRNAVMASLIVVIAFAVVWSLASVTLGRVFPWMTLVLGLILGYAVRRAGQGIDWRFPVIAATFAFAGSILGNVVVGAAFAARELGTTTLTVLGSASEFTWPTFFDEVITAADVIYAFSAAGIAAYFANRRLDRREFQALRLYQGWHSDE